MKIQMNVIYQHQYLDVIYHMCQYIQMDIIGKMRINALTSIIMIWVSYVSRGWIIAVDVHASRVRAHIFAFKHTRLIYVIHPWVCVRLIYVILTYAHTHANMHTHSHTHLCSHTFTSTNMLVYMNTPIQIHILTFMHSI